MKAWLDRLALKRRRAPYYRYRKTHGNLDYFHWSAWEFIASLYGHNSLEWVEDELWSADDSGPPTLSPSDDAG